MGTSENVQSPPAASGSSEAAEFDNLRLLIPEVTAYLRERGIQVHLALRDRLGGPLDAATLDGLQRLLSAHESSRAWERRMLEIGPLSAAVSHEVRNAIGGVVGLAQLGLARSRSVLDPAVGQPDVSDALQTIARESQRSLEILSGYLEYANPRNSTAQLVSAAALIEPVIQMMTFQAKQKGCKLFASIAPGLPEIVIRASELREVLLNLLVNAIYASEREGTVEVIADRPNLENLRIRILDAGPGVPADLKNKIFDEYFTTKPPGEGTGLGLALASRIIHSHGGSLTVRDRDGGGAEFVVELPFDQDIAKISERGVPT